VAYFELASVSKGYGPPGRRTEVLRDIDLEIAEGESGQPELQGLFDELSRLGGSPQEGEARSTEQLHEHRPLALC